LFFGLKTFQKCNEGAFMKHVILSFKSIATISKQVGVNPNEAFHIITKHYCQKMIMAGYCPQRCAACKPAIMEIFNLKEANKKEALMVYKARDEYAKAQEVHSLKDKSQPKEKSFMDLFEKKSENSIQNLLNLVEQL